MSEEAKKKAAKKLSEDKRNGKQECRLLSPNKIPLPQRGEGNRRAGEGRKNQTSFQIFEHVRVERSQENKRRCNRDVATIIKPLTLFSDFRGSLKSKTVLSPLGRGGKVAFTLAEVLITLGIIGVVAAMTIPTVITKYKEKQTVTQLKAAQSILYNAIKLAEAENGPLETWGELGLTEECSKLVADKIKPYLKIVKDCGVDDSNGVCIGKGYYKKLTGSNHANYSENNVYHAYKIILSNGISVFWHGSGNNIYFMVDLNGSKEPNTWGKDLFSFVYKDGKLIPSGAEGSEYTYEADCLDENAGGWGCAAYVLLHEKTDYLRK